MARRSFFGESGRESDSTPMGASVSYGPSEPSAISFEQGVARVRELLERVDDVPSIPASAARVMELAADPEVSARTVADAVSVDPALTTRVLRIVNSVAYGMPRRVSTVSHAVVIMGMNALRSAVISASVASELAVSADATGLDPTAFWRHCAGTAVGGRIVAKHFGLAGTGEVFVGGLLHDVGRLVLARTLPLQHRRVVRRMKAEEVDVITAELDEFGCTHCHAGWWLADQWNLPEDLQYAAGHHHDAARAGEGAQTAAVVELADLLSRSLGLDEGEGLAGDFANGEGLDASDLPIRASTWQVLLSIKRDLDRSELPQLRHRLEGEFDQCLSFARGILNEPE